MKKIKSIIDAITNSSSETYIIHNSREDELGNYGKGGEGCSWMRFDYDDMKNLKSGYYKDQLLEILEYGFGKTLISKDLPWPEFVEANREAFMELTDYLKVWGPEDHYEGYEDDWDELRGMSMYYFGRG